MFGYSLDQIQKTVVSFVFFVGAVLALVFADYDPSFTEALVVLTGALFGVIGVFLAKNHTVDDLSKAVAQLQGAALSVVGYFVVLDPGTVETIGVAVAALISVYGVYKRANAPVTSSNAVRNPKFR